MKERKEQLLQIWAQLANPKMNEKNLANALTLVLNKIKVEKV